MGRHADDTRKRGIAGWLVIAAAALSVVVVLSVAYLVWLNSDEGAGTVDGRCTGDARIDVVAGGSAEVMRLVVDAYNATTPAARGTCLTARLSTVPSAWTADALVSGWGNQAVPQPAVWIADNSADLDTVVGGAPALVAGHNDTPVAVSPVVLAVRPADVDAVPADLTWPGLTAALAGLGGVTLPDGDPLTLALGDPRADRATSYAIESAIATGGGDTAATVEDVAAAQGLLAELARSSTVTTSTTDLLDDLANGPTAFRALPVLESTLAQYNSTAADPLRAVYLQGPTVGDTLIGVGLTATWIDETEVEGAAAFLAFLNSEAGTSLLQQAGYRLPDAPAAPVDGVHPDTPVASRPAAPMAVSVAIAGAMGLPAETAAVPTTTS